MGQSRKELYIMGCVTIFPDIFKTDRFLSLDRSARLLYFDLLLNADDYGFVGNVKSVIRLTEAKKKDLTMLADSGYVHVFKSGVVVIMHWWLHFRQRKSRIRCGRRPRRLNRRSPRLMPANPCPLLLHPSHQAIQCRRKRLPSPCQQICRNLTTKRRLNHRQSTLLRVTTCRQVTHPPVPLCRLLRRRRR